MLEVNSENVNKRLDVYLTEILGKSRSSIDKDIKSGNILVNDVKVKNGYSLKLGDKVTIKENDTNYITKEEMPLDICYEDEYLLVVNKPSGLVVHPGNGNKSHTLVNGLMYYTDELSDINGEEVEDIYYHLPGLNGRTVRIELDGILVVVQCPLPISFLSVGISP